MNATQRTTPTNKIDQVKELIGKAELVRVSFGTDGRTPRGDSRALRVVVRSGNPELRASLGDPTAVGVAEFPMPLRKGELQIEFGEGCPGVRISSRSEPPTSWHGTDDPVLQTWLERQVEKIKVRAAANRSHALQWTSVRGKGVETQWSAIFEPGQVGMRSAPREAVATLGA